MIVIAIVAAVIIGGGLGYAAIKAPMLGKTVAQINGKSLTMDDIERELSKVPPVLQAALQDQEGKRRFLENLIKKELLLQEAQRRGLERSAEVQEKLAELKQTMILEALLTKEIEEKIKVSDEELNEYLRSRAEQANVRHILVSTEAEARALQARLQKGESFEKLAKAYSLDSNSSGRGGELGFFSRGQTNSPFEEAAFKLQPGQVSEPVKTDYGYHLIKLIARRHLQLKDLEPLRERVRDNLREEKQKQALNKLIADLRAKAKISIKEEAFKVETGEKGKAESEKGKANTGGARK
jgi:peptidyl-prolyl cis-trans isomerase C